MRFLNQYINFIYEKLNTKITRRNKSNNLSSSVPLFNAASLPTAVPATTSTTSSSSSLLDVEGLLGLPPSLLQMTEDQLPGTSFTADPNTPFVSFSPPLDHDDYLWSLEDSEGVSDFFDTYDLGDLLKSWGIDEGGEGKCSEEGGRVFNWMPSRVQKYYTMKPSLCFCHACFNMNNSKGGFAPLCSSNWKKKITFVHINVRLSEEGVMLRLIVMCVLLNQ